MKVSYKAALLSALVFPGVGHLYLKRYRRGLLILFSVITGLGYLIWSAAEAVLDRLDDVMARVQGGATNLEALSDIVRSKMPTADPYLDAVLTIIVCLWIFSVIDAYRIGKHGELQGKGTSH